MDNTAISLHELNRLIRGVIHDSLPEMFWIRAEMSDVRANQNGHCYLEFIEKDTLGKSIVAKARAMIWANTFFILKAYFENATNQPFASGLKVLVKVSIEFHELYGFSLTVHDIDPTYTLGDQAINRAAIIKQLQEDGVIDLNKELELPLPTNRIAIISSPTAAGYEDFCNQLENNPFGFAFYTKLFPAIMQGDRAEDSIISALEKIYEYQDCFDAVVIIRGGGATSELSCFDSYLLAASCAQFPLPIITGIGHERDETVLDIVAHTRAKTPTAVAEFLINNMGEIAEELDSLQIGITSTIALHLQENMLQLNTVEAHISFLLKNWHKEQQNKMLSIKEVLRKEVQKIVRNEQNTFSLLGNSLSRNMHQAIKGNETRLETFEKHLNLISPETILKKGYTLTMKNGKIVKHTDSLEKGDTITTVFAKGQVESIIKKI
ncbi:exodeoxyribonuclease VII large subunit [Dysgonomonas sp. ZJ279]|uniref:exodeoxyribonuclease VII large subunit n=1 Tax=Dysgonomonas sp. ZJ279 TaxID=2709796 RepID=UPI0013EAB987|nr:exodeoxyribonuclease VII large subunit [Dysgonomonas sp. ZJ279]